MLEVDTFIKTDRCWYTFTEEQLHDRDRIRWAWTAAVSRSPEPYEIGMLMELLASNRERYRRDDTSAGALQRIGQSAPAAESGIVESAAWTSVARAILNLHEFTTRN